MMVVKKHVCRFPSEEFAARLAARGVSIGEPLFCKYKLPNGWDEQKLQDYAVAFMDTKNKKEIMLGGGLAKQIKTLNPELDFVKIASGSVFEIGSFLWGVASRFTARDINYFIWLRQIPLRHKANRLADAENTLKSRKIKELTGELVGFIIEPKALERIIAAIDMAKAEEHAEKFKAFMAEKNYEP